MPGGWATKGVIAPSSASSSYIYNPLLLPRYALFPLPTPTIRSTFHDTRSLVVHQSQVDPILYCGARSAAHDSP